MNPAAKLGLLLASLLLLRATASHAHAVGISRGDYRGDGAQVQADLVFARQELIATFPGLDADGNGELAREEVESARGRLADWIARGVEVRVASEPCTPGLADIELTEQDGLAFHALYRCPHPAAVFAVRLALFAQLSLGHRHLAAAISPSQSAHGALYEAEPQIELDANVSAAASRLGGLMRLGIEHILTGYDHLLFLLALVLVGGPLRSLLAAVTAFTLAHSLTLAVAALGIWTPQPAFVEPAIALSIACIGIENCFVSDLSGRWRLTFGFGLIHGFGFAGALREIALPAAQLPLALASFNLGVELGQLAVLALVLPLVYWLGRRARFANGGLQACSIAISAMGLWWFVARLADG